jgi:hypothetical protein
MRALAWGIVLGLAVIAPRAEGGSACRCRFEVAGADGLPLAVTRATRTADGPACTFDVRLRVADPDRCTGAQSVVRGIPRERSATGWGEGWERVTLKPRPHRHVLRARVRGESGPAGRARLALRCKGRVALEGCEAVEGESVSCFIGGGSRIRVVGLDSGTVCPDDASQPKQELVSENLAVWNGVAYTCPGGSAGGGFVATPAEGGDSRIIAGPCTAVTTDGQSLYVLPAANFDTIPHTLRFPHVATEETGRPDLVPIRAYDVPENIPARSSRVVLDPATLPADSPCTGVAFNHLAAFDGVLYAAGCRPSDDGCTPQPQICVFDTRTGVVLPSLTLEDFSGPIRGMSAMDGGRLLVLTDDQSSVPPIGYVPAAPGLSGTSPELGPPERIHIFDTATGARLDTRVVGTSGATGISCTAPAQ